MASFNRVILVGNLTRDPELRTFPSGTSVADVGLAVNERRRDQNGNWVDEPNFFDVAVWGRNAEVLREYTRKGSSILVEGRLKQDTWEQDGQKRSKVKVIADRIQLLSPRDSGQGGGNYQTGGYQASNGGYQQQQQRPQRGGYSNAPSGGEYYGDAQQGSNFPQDPGDEIPF